MRVVDFRGEWRGIAILIEGGQPWRLLKQNRVVRKYGRAA